MTPDQVEHGKKVAARAPFARASRAVVENLESRLLLSVVHYRTLSGRIFNDINGNGTRQLNEHFLAGVTVFLDSNSNGVPDVTEPTTVTNRVGAFTFRKLLPGIYNVVQIPPQGDVATIPVDGVRAVDLTRRSVLNLKFGDKAGPPAPPDTTPPAGALSALDLTMAGISPYRFDVGWTDADGVDITSFSDSNIIVTGPAGFSEAANLVALDNTTNGSPRTTTYQIPAPAGGWAFADDGVYTVSLQSGQVRDVLGNTDPAATLGTFNVNIPPAVETPTLVNGVNGVTTGNNSSPSRAISFTLTGTIPGSQLTLLADGTAVGSASVTSSTTTLTTDGTTMLSDGGHTFVVQQRLSNGTQDSSAPMTVTVDTTGPTAALNAATLTSSMSTYNFNVTYTDATSVAVNSCSRPCVVVTGPGGFNQTATFVSVDSNSDGPTRTATYQITAPGGGNWSSARNGMYTVTLQSNKVTDEVGNAAAGAALGTFSININSAVSAVPAAPVLTASSDSGAYSNDSLTNRNNASAGSAMQFTVTGTDAGATISLYCDGSLIGSATAIGATTTVSTNGKKTLTNGTHLFTARQTDPGLIQSTDSNPTGVIIDTQPPTATSVPPNVTGGGATKYTFFVVYHDNISVHIASLSNGDVVVTGPNGFSQPATFVSVNAFGDGSPCTATYYITPPGGSWDGNDNGTYTVNLQSGAVFDTAGNGSAAATLGSFNVNAGIPSSPAPAAPVLLAGSDTGSSNSDDITRLNNSSPGKALQFSVGSTVAGAAVTLYADGNLIGSATAGSTTTIITTDGTTLLSDGPHTITARQTVSGKGGSVDSTGTTVTIDTAAPSASALSATNVTSAGATSYQFTVTYADNQAVAKSSLDGGDILITAPDNSSIPVSLVSVSPNANGSPLRATYQFTPPGGSWTAADNGTYTITLIAAQVQDVAGNGNAVQTLGQITAAISVSPTPNAPTLLAVSDTGVSSSDGLTKLNNSSAGTELQFKVTGTVAGATVSLFADGVAIGSATAGGSTTTITTNGSFTLSNGAHVFTATQSVPGQDLSSASSATTVNIDTSLPAASALNASNVTTGGGTSYQFTVTYADDRAIDIASIGNLDITFTAPDNSVLSTTRVSVTPNSNTTPVTATYQLIPPDGAWSSADNGMYTIKLVAGQVSDTAGNGVLAQTLGVITVSVADVSPTPAAPTLAAATDSGASNSDGITNFNNSSPGKALQFSVGNTVAGAAVTLYADGNAIGSATAGGSTTTITTNGSSTLANGAHTFTATQTVPGDSASATSATTTVNVDTSLPAASALNAGNVTSSGGTTYQFTVTYADDRAIDISSLGTGDVTITAPDNSVHSTSLISVNPNSDGTPRTATYQLTPPGGAWTSADNGTYTIKLVGGQVQDIAGNSALPQTLGQITVAVPVSPTPNAPNLLAASDTGTSSSDDVTRLNNTPGKTLQFTVSGTIGSAVVTLYADGTAIGSATAAGSSTTITTNGTFTLSNGIHVFTASQSAPGEDPSPASAGLNVNIDTSVPSVSALSANDVTTAGGASYQFTVTYADNTAIDTSTLGSSNILVTGPNGYSVLATFVSVDTAGPGSPRTATYQITPPNGAWDMSANGAYVLTLQIGQVFDTAGNATPSGVIGGFNVNIPMGG